VTFHRTPQQRIRFGSRALALSFATLLACSHSTAPPAPNGKAPLSQPILVTSAAQRLDDEAQQREAIRRRLDALANESIGFWKSHGVDAKNGGFYGTLNRNGQAIEPSDKGAIQQARHLWSFSMWYARRERTPEVRAIADNVYRFLVSHFRDPRDGEFFYKVSAAGEIRDRKKPLYAQSFAIYGLSQYAASFGSEEARGYALECFRSVDRRAHDPVHGGYDQSEDPFFFTPGTQKQTNTHIHLLEAFTALYRATHDRTVRARLAEMATLTATRIVQPAGYARQEFTRDFTPFGVTEVSYGHDIETSWLLYDALSALGEAEQRALYDVSYRLGRTALNSGFDAKNSGLFEAGEPGAPPSKLEKVWWIQAETLPGIARLYLTRPEPNDLARLEATLTFIEQHLRDPEYGEWYWSALSDGSPSSHGTNKGEEWKASYHALRALVLASDWLKTLPTGG
jgi:mannobiose 2-epimerase